MLKRVFILLVLATVIAGACALSAGCGGGGTTTEETVTPAEETGETVVSPDPARTITMTGRSVMEGWMKHWGYAWEGPVEKNGRIFDYKALDADNIVSSFKESISGLQPGSVVFFKFCFADFSGDNLAERESQVQEVVRAAKEKGLKLIIGNALPVQARDGSPELKAEYAAFNGFLDKVASENDNVWIFDFYGVLAGSDGFLSPKYETGDAHPNDQAYEVLDQTFFPLLDRVFGG